MEADTVHDTTFSTPGPASNPTSSDRNAITRTNANETTLAPSRIVDEITFSAPISTHDIMLNSEPQPVTPISRGADDNSPKANTESKARTTIEQAKDRAQITAATSMSIVHVALLKDTLDAGKDGTRYYEWMLGFILSALILQVLAGLLALYIALLRQYYTQYKDDFLGDCAKICCPFTCKRKKHKHVTFDHWFEDQSMAIPSTAATSKNECEEQRSCCPSWECAINQFEDLDYRILDLYENWCEKGIKTDIKCANIDARITALSDEITRHQVKLKQWKSSDLEPSDLDLQTRVKHRVETAKIAREELEKEKRSAMNLVAQGVVLKRYVDNIQKEQVLKRATFWQNTLGIILYVVFMLNAVIVGFGLATRPDDNNQGGRNSTQS